MLLNKKEKDLKEVRHKIDRLNELYQMERKAGYVQLEEPEFYGWKKFYDLKKEVKTDINYKYYKGLYDLVYNEVISTNKNFERKTFNVDNMFNKRIIELKPKTFGEYEFTKIVPEKYRDEFRLEVHEEFRWGCFSRVDYRWVLIDDWFLEEKIEKAYRTEKKLIFPEVKSEIDKLTDELFDKKSNLVKKLGSGKKSFWDIKDEQQYHKLFDKLEKQFVEDELYELGIDISNSKIDI